VNFKNTDAKLCTFFIQGYKEHLGNLSEKCKILGGEHWLS